MFRKFQEDEFKLGIKTGRITREIWDKQQKIRREIQQEIQKLNAQRKLFLAEKSKETNKDDLENAILKAIKSQAARKNYRW